MKEIPLTQGKVAIVDDEDFEWLSQWKWHCMKGYAARHPAGPHGQKYIYMHRKIMRTPDDMDADHINHNTFDNRRLNLRNCTHAENSRNQITQKRSITGFKGVSFDSERKKWKAQIQLNSIGKIIGRFSTPEAAARAYDEMAKKLFGEFTNLNFSE